MPTQVISWATIRQLILMNQLSVAEIKKELTRFDDLMEKITGRRTTAFRAPYGEYSDTVITTVREMGYEIYQWDIDLIALKWKC